MIGALSAVTLRKRSALVCRHGVFPKSVIGLAHFQAMQIG